MGAFQILTPLFQLALDYEKEIPAFPHRHVVCYVLKNPQSDGRPCRCVYLHVHSESRLKKTDQILSPQLVKLTNVSSEMHNIYCTLMEQLILQRWKT